MCLLDFDLGAGVNSTAFIERVHAQHFKNHILFGISAYQQGADVNTDFKYFTEETKKNLYPFNVRELDRRFMGRVVCLWK